MDMVVLLGQSRDEVVESAKLTSIVNTSSCPGRRPDAGGDHGVQRPWSGDLRRSLTLAGAMAPVTPAGALVLQNAEARRPWLTQMVSPCR